MASDDYHVMSLEQLDSLWRYEFQLCSLLTGLPLRSCNAKPNNALSDLFPAMNNEKFCLLKEDIRKMWVKSAHYFRFKNKDGKGWGIFCPSHEDEGYPTAGCLSPTKPTIMGWLAKAPTDDQCPTAHRYLRSPLGENLYLGGPISLANQDPVSRITVHAPTGKRTAERHLVTVLSKRKLLPGSELLWTYVGDAVFAKNLHLSPVTEWFLTKCCSEVEAPLLAEDQLPGPSASAPSPASTVASVPLAKRQKRVVGGMRPLTLSQELPRFCLCTYCGVNVDAHSSYSPNLKRHLSLHHAVDVVKEIGRDPLDQQNPVTSKEFTLQLDKIDNVLDGLHKHFFSYQPACTFLHNFGKDVQLRKGKPIEDEKERVFQLFIRESLSVFKKYQIIYLKGASVPTGYDDLLPCSKYTSHDHVIWCGEKPSNTNFSINTFNLTKEEKAAQKQQIKCALSDIIDVYQMEDSESEV